MPLYNVQHWPPGQPELACYLAAGNRDDGRPVVVMLHGAFSRADALGAWSDRLADVADTMLIDLPNHGQSAEGPIDLAGMTARIGAAVGDLLAGRRVLLVGESLGGLIALGLGGAADLGPVRAVFAADPPMTTTKIWPVHKAVWAAIARDGEGSLAHRLAGEIFGTQPNYGLEERIYYPLIGALRVPTVIATGDVKLMPARQVTGTASLFDKVDEFVLRTYHPGKVEIEHIAGADHLILADAPDACLAIIRRMLTTLG